MRNLIRGSILGFLLLCGATLGSAQCYYGYGYINGYYPYCDIVKQGENLSVDYGIDYPWGWASVSLDISTDGGNSWYEVATEQPYGYYQQVYITIPFWLTPSTNCHVRMREVPYSYYDCAYNYDGYSYSYYYGCPFTIQKGCVQPYTSNPTNQIGCVGFPTTFSMSASTGTDIRYEWYRGTTLVSTQGPSLTLGSVTLNDAGTYFLRVKDICGKQIDSKTATLVVNSPAVITTQPVGSTICPGMNGSLTIAATGTNVTYQWRRGGVNITGATTNTYNIVGATVADDGIYTCVVTAICGPVVTSTPATIVVPAPPVIVQQPVGGGYCPGTDAVVTTVVTGNGLRFQWYKDEVPVPGATLSTLTITNIQPSNVGSYWLKITGGAGACITTANSQPTFVFTYGPPRIMKQPSSIDLCVGAQSELIVSAEGTDLRYQWYRNGSPIANSNNYSLILTGAAGVGGTYTVDVRSACNGFVKSETVTVTVIQTPKITMQPSPQNLNVGETLTLEVAASDARTITWLRNEQVVSEGTSATYTIPAVMVSDGGYYRAIVSNGCGSATSHTALVLITDPASLVPVMEITSENLSMGDVPFGYEKDRTFDALMVNLGAASLNVSGMSISGADASAFTVMNAGTPFSLAPGEARSVQIRFRPSRIGSATASLDITSNAAPGSHSVVITGNGVLLYSSEPMLSFGNVMLGQSKDDCMEVTNNSATDITIDQINLSGANVGDFTLTTTTPLALGAGQSADVCLTFAPTATGRRTVIISYMSSTGGNTGAGAEGNGEPAVGVSEDALEAGMTIYPNPTTGSVTINTGGAIANNIAVVSVTGQVVATMNPTTALVQWDCKSSDGSNIPAGTYTVVINTAAGSYSIPLSIVR